MVTARIEGMEKLEALKAGLASAIPSEAEMQLDRWAVQAKEKMSSEAPKMTGQLSNTIDIISQTNKRIIEPTATRLDGGKYALPVESGSRAHFPNIENIAYWYGVNRELAFVIAKGISEKSHSATNFVKKTADYINNEIKKSASDFARRIVARISYV